ncbi:YqaA family protein [Sphingomonas kaistensis]|uniref:YqaA family protein n=1 Tax=Sphingomonas kaistensis TaxID=298708 RepID=A0ABZ2G001_9SPHN
MTGSAAYLSLFGAAFLAATIFPAQSEILLAYLLGQRTLDWTMLLLVATAGNVLGSVLNWALGRFLERFRDRKWFPVRPAALERAERWYARWGKWSLLLSWVPVIGDPLTVIAGMLKVRLLPFFLLVLLAKAGRYLVVALAVAGIRPA